MELQGFETRSTPAPGGGRMIDYYLTGSAKSKSIRLRISTADEICIEYVEYGALPEAGKNERVTSPVYSDEILGRMLRAMASRHMNADWLEDGFTRIDLEMIDRGFEIGRLKSGELLWFRREYGSTFMVRRVGSVVLPSSYEDVTQMVVIGPSRHELVVDALDYRSLLMFIDADGHYNNYHPRIDTRLEGIYSLDFVTVH